MKTTRVEIDLNSVRPDGTTRVLLADVTGPIQQGQMVTAFESEDRVAAQAYVTRVDEARGVAFVIVNRDSMTDDDGVSTPTISYAGANRAVAQVANAQAARVTNVQHAHVRNARTTVHS